MSQATITADILGTKGQMARTTNRASLALVLTAVLAGAALALAGNAAINAYQASVAADQASRATSERISAGAGASNVERSVVQHLLNERQESPSWTHSLNAIPVLLQSSPAEAAEWGLPQEAIPVFMQDTLFTNPESDEQP